MKRSEMDQALSILKELWVTLPVAGEWDQMAFQGPVQLKPIYDLCQGSISRGAWRRQNHGITGFQGRKLCRSPSPTPPKAGSLGQAAEHSAADPRLNNKVNPSLSSLGSHCFFIWFSVYWFALKGKKEKQKKSAF